MYNPSRTLESNLAVFGSEIELPKVGDGYLIIEATQESSAYVE